MGGTKIGSPLIAAIDWLRSRMRWAHTPEYDRLVRILSSQAAVWTSVTFLYWAFGLTIGQASAIGWALLCVTSDWSQER